METIMYHPEVKNVIVYHHRNGSGGEPFYVCIFDTREIDDKKPDRNEVEFHRMFAVVFDDDTYCAVFSLSELARENIEFARGNSFRGDYFEPYLREAIKEWESHSEDRLQASLEALNASIEARKSKT